MGSNFLSAKKINFCSRSFIKYYGNVILALSFLISPLGIPAIAEWLIDRLNGLNYLLRDYIMG